MAHAILNLWLGFKGVGGDTALAIVAPSHQWSTPLYLFDPSLRTGIALRSPIADGPATVITFLLLGIVLSSQVFLICYDTILIQKALLYPSVAWKRPLFRREKVLENQGARTFATSSWPEAS